MQIIGPDYLVFGVDGLEACGQFLLDYGLTPVGADASGGLYEALDGTGVILRRADDPSLPPALGTGNTIRETVYGVRDTHALDAIAAELGRDREVIRHSNGSVSCMDDFGFALRFQLSVRRAFEAAPVLTNSPGCPPQRPPNQLAVQTTVEARPRSLSHVVYFVPDSARAEAFYARLGFRVTDRFAGVGAFMRPAGTLDHHTLFMIQTPPFMRGVEHFTFHMGGPAEVLEAGTRLVDKGYQSFWGPGRHIFGSNWFWYFNSPMGVHIEYDADMDLHDDLWVPRTAGLSADNSQAFLFQHRAKWVPGGPPPP
jgi:catechol 2,3-dioxygenase-like lactoylglutathione lyase family enzyme